MNVEDLTLLVSILRDAQDKVDGLDAQIKRAKEVVRRMEEETIPCAMQEMGVDEIKLTDGTKVTIKDDVYVAIPKANQEQAYEWLNSKGHGGMIKIDVVAHFNKGSLPFVFNAFFASRANSCILRSRSKRVSIAS